MKNQSAKKGPRMSCGGNGGVGASSRRLSLGGPMPPPTKATPNTRTAKKNDHRNNHHDSLKDDGIQALSSGNFLISL